MKQYMFGILKILNLKKKKAENLAKNGSKVLFVSSYSSKTLLIMNKCPILLIYLFFKSASICRNSRWLAGSPAPRL